MKNSHKNYIVLLVTVLILFLIDRLLLLFLGLPLWEWDEKLHYKHRANATRYWHSYKNKPIYINEYGHHDHSFPRKKKKNELRILNLGDSITMGHGVTRDETYSKYMEAYLAGMLKDYSKIEVINAGVQGYSTFQELELLKRSLLFEPDIVTIGFCLNDVTEPFAVNKNLGGVGLDYHRVTQAPNKFLSYILNETGFGRLVQEIRARSLDAKQEKLNETFDVKKILMNPADSVYNKQWAFTLNELSKIYTLCRDKNIPALLLVFPFTFQLKDSTLVWAQDRVIKHSANYKINKIDFLEVFRNAIGNDSTKDSHYFLDEDHFTPAGHKFVAQAVSKAVVNILKSN